LILRQLQYGWFSNTDFAIKGYCNVHYLKDFTFEVKRVTSTTWKPCIETRYGDTEYAGKISIRSIGKERCVHAEQTPLDVLGDALVLKVPAEEIEDNMVTDACNSEEECVVQEKNSRGCNRDAMDSIE